MNAVFQAVEHDFTRVDAMETTMAHIIPEFTANILLPLVMFVYMMILDWRLGLSNLIPVAIGLSIWSLWGLDQTF